ncbi:DNA polymerase IV [Sphingomonas carotinifaciens]|uniref:DNA polymerase IV n=1 Tax=Sphingomonas carotinifaciens TaxID=1166323 RepID=A0A1G7F0R5_9SPHN|nr:DNA polymerase IV [Sphingomonas carotinifaciens]MBB4085820.1 DNA polymerase-4 [Sphingomonas carotinifaciens]MWC45211.1 DNA polymerase IV [Sphingomonas carotinifaciens]SDE69165.1 DNA polymerase-4 [Sphingomonas carotinifaciens]
MSSAQDTPAANRKIIHVDMDAFYASVEQRDDPALRGRPVAVGGSRARGVVAAASYEARRFGVRSAMPSSTAVRRCPDLVFVKPRFEVYRAVSHQIREIFARYTPLIEPLSLDEAYLDVTEDRMGLGSAQAIAQAIRAAIHAETHLTASAGVSYNKFIAKLASDQNKPDGMCVIPPARGPAFVASLPVSRFHGVGPVTARKMEALGILTGADLRDRPLPFLQAHFGSYADYLYRAARGVDERPVRVERTPKSVGAERTFETDLSARTDLHDALERVADAAWVRIERAAIAGRTVTLKLRHADFRTITRARSFPHPVGDRPTILAAGRLLLDAQLPVVGGVRLLGLTLSGLTAADAVDTEIQPRLPL